MEKILSIGNHGTWRNGPLNEEHFSEPSMCEPVHNLTIEEILRDYSRGIVHTSRPALYDGDDDSDVEEVDTFEDITDVLSDDAQHTTETDPIAPAPSEPAQDPAQEDSNTSE